MKELIAHIEAQNAKTQEWVDADPTNRWAGFIVTDPNHWEEYGIYTVAQYEHYMAQVDVVEMYKEVHGIKPRWMNMDEMSIEELEAELQSLCVIAQEQDEYYDHWSEMLEAQDKLDREEDRVAMELEPTKYEIMAEQAGY